jgi:hypothetical protein
MMSEVVPKSGPSMKPRAMTEPIAAVPEHLGGMEPNVAVGEHGYQ